MTAPVADATPRPAATFLAASHPTAARWEAWRPLALRLASLLVFVGAWEWAGRVPISAGFPTFTETMAAFGAMLLDLSLPKSFAITLLPLAIGIAISATFGIGAGVAMGLSRRAEWLGVPFFVVLQAAPLAALIPLLIIAYGVGIATKVATVCVLALPVIVLNAFKAVRNTPESLLEMGRSFLGTRRQLILMVVLPSASPVIFAGLRLGVAAGFIGAILAELLITPTGIGDIISYAQSVADYPRMYAAILSVILLSVAIMECLERIESAMFRPEKRAL